MITNRFCPKCGGNLELLAGNLYSCWQCGIPYNLIDGNLIVVDFEAEDEADGYVEEYADDYKDEDDYEDDDISEEQFEEPQLQKETANPPTTDTTQPQRQITPTNIENNVQQQQKQVEQKPIKNNEQIQTNVTNKYSQKSSKLTKKTLIVLCVCAIIAVALIVVAFVAKFEFAPIILILYGVAVLILGIVLWNVLPKKARQLCPNCGNKREHHRTFVNTTSTKKMINMNGGIQNFDIKYIHHYIDTYTCPHCGESAKYQVTSSGGEARFRYDSGLTEHRIEPREF